MPQIGWESWPAAAVALAIGLLIGSERERHAAGPGAGVRTFGLVALAGCLAALVSPVLAGAVGLGVAVLAAVSYLRTADRDVGATTEVALVLTVVIGAVSAASPALAAAAGVATAVVLLSKDRLHRFVRRTVTDVELTDALKFFVVAFIVLPLVPSTRIGPYDAIDPRRVWTLVVLVTALGWLGYVAVRALGPGRGMPVAGLAGGFVSGTATTGTTAAQARTAPALFRPSLAGALLASVGTLVQLVIVTAVVDGRVAARLAPAVVAGTLVLAGQALLLSRGAATADEDGSDKRPSIRPFQLVPAVILAGVLTVLLVVAAWAQDVFGPRGATLAIAGSGLADAHAGALTAVTLSWEGIFTVHTATMAALAALGVNTVVKVIVAYVAGGRRFGSWFTALIAMPVLAVVAAVVATFAVVT